MRKIGFILLAVLLIYSLTACTEVEVNSVLGPKVKNVQIVPTMQDSISEDAAWCATFQLVWNDMKNEVVKQDIVYTPQLEIAKHLNQEEFTEDMLSEEYYYKVYGLKTLELKEKIEKGIQEKFNETSDILEDFDWSEDALDHSEDTKARRYFFYTMLRRDFEFPKEFTELVKASFAGKYEDVEYFGIEKDTEEVVREQVKVLFYKNTEEYAVLLNTKTGDEVVLYRTKEGDNFQEIYERMLKEEEEYQGLKVFEGTDTLKVPNLKIGEKKVYEEFEGKEFPTADPSYPVAEIMKAIQTVEFELNKKGGSIKSESGIDMIMKNSLPIAREPRNFNFDDTFTIFLREKGKEKPYFAAKISDITKFQ